MNLYQLRYFAELAQEQHYTNAAQHLNISQPSLSHAISQLEEELGVQLFENPGGKAQDHCPANPKIIQGREEMGCDLPDRKG